MSNTFTARRTAPAILAATLVMVSMALGVMPAAAAPPAAPTGLSADVRTVSTTFLTWDHMANATRYEVQIDNQADFQSPYGLPTATVSQTTNNTFVPTVNLPAGTTYWRVRALNGSDPSDWSLGDFVVGTGAAPQLLSPAPGQPLPQPEEPPLLSWTSVDGAIDYVVEVDGDSDFVGSTSYTTKSTSLVVPDALGGGDWFWRVRATKANAVNTPVSASSSFVIVPLRAPGLTSPPNAAVTSGPVPPPVQDIRLDWEAVPGASHYKLEVARNVDFSSPVPGWTAPSKIFGTSYSPKVTWGNGSYYWRVRSVDADGNESGWSDVWMFRRNWPQTPVPVYPLGEESAPPVVGDPMYFQWTPVKHASEYELQVSAESGFPPLYTSTCVTAGTTYTPGAFSINTTDRGLPATLRPDEDCEPTPGVTNYWRVRPLDRPYVDGATVPQGVWGINTSGQAFKYLPEGITDMAPTDNVLLPAGAIPTLSWESNSKASETYTIEIRKANGNFVIPTVTTSATSFTLSGKTRLNPADGPFRWIIKSTSTDGISSVTYTNYFRVSDSTGPAGPASPADRLNPISPAPDAAGTLEAPRLRWEAWPGAAYYQVSIGEASNTVPQGWFTTTGPSLWDEPVAYPAMTDTSRELLAPGQYDWRVTAYGADDVPLGTGPEGRFTIAPFTAVGGQRVAISGKGTDVANHPCTPTSGTCVVPATPVLRWDPVPRTSFYMVYVSYDRDFTELLEEPRAIPATTNTMYAPTLSNLVSAYPDSQAGDPDSALYWHVRPCRAENKCALGPESRTNAFQHTFKKSSPPVELTSPAAGETVSSADVTFTWRDYFETNQSELWDQTDEPRPQAGMKYRLQVSDSASFGTILEDVEVDQATYTSADLLYADATYWWRVQAIDSDSNRLAWSAGPRSFVKTSPQPFAISPVDATVSGPTPFRWEAQAGAASYDIQLAQNNDATWTGSNPIFGTKRVSTTAFSYDRPLAPSTTPYVWRVRRVDPKTNTGPWSGPKRFYVSSAQLSLTSPADGASQGPTGPVLSWQPLTGASTYNVEVRNATTGGLVTAADTVANSWAVPSALATGTYNWKVTARDAATNVLVVKQSSFVVDAQLVGTTPPGITTPNGTGIGETLGVTAPTWSQPFVTSTYQWLRDGSPIAGATATAYTLVTADYGRQISVRATGNKPGFAAGTSTSPAINPVAGSALVYTEAPSITVPPPGTTTAAVGALLTGNKGTWANSPTLTSEWLRDGSPIPGATAPNYRIVAEDAGTAITFRVHATKAGFEPGVADSSPVTVVSLAALSPVQLGTPGGTGVGATAVSSPPAWNQADVTTTYQWLRDGAAIPGATQPAYALTVTDFGRSVSVRATGAKSGFSNATSTSSPITVTAGSPMTTTVVPTINGTATIGGSISATTGTWSGTPSSYRYQWLRDGQAISGATSLSYRVLPEDATHTLSVRVTAVRASYQDGVATSAGVIVAKMKSTTTAFATPTKVTRAQRAKLSIAIALIGSSGPTGSITVKDGSKKLKVISLVASKMGRVTFKLPKLKKTGKHKIKVSYSGNGFIEGSKAKTVVIKVTR